ncbi:ribonuclease R [Robbsia andropogonis]|uniref:Ribonuclease R n=1 Tax=Robbsia andropogonis TaxID=28092 RepID=A0A0F5K2M1_9BURK|nr:YihY/virulence factor BrkB family protein [Robbsia andropogonis]KKB63797.1 ribonuclease R [Robbsia andropogonis]MCP1116545.1 YihY/virulence factor BrkB family protein [Robbsia andropogonis]MCP1126776.1 YihY/virulence factor BrkB family protein [Robbsia andropogonis]
MLTRLGTNLRRVGRHPVRFAWDAARHFKDNQGLLLAGAVAYYALLSIVPLMILIVIGLSHFVPRAMLLDTLRHLLEWLVPGQARAVVRELDAFVQHRGVLGWLLLATMIFFSSLAFTVLEKAMAVIFTHRVTVQRRHAVMSALLPYFCSICLGAGVLIITFVSSGLEAIGANGVELLGYHIPLGGATRTTLYLLGLGGEVCVLTAIYLVLPARRPFFNDALLGAIIAAILWEITRHFLVWYFATLSQVSVVYGSLTTSIVVLFSLEALATLLLFGAQIIAEFERLDGRFAGEPALSR